MDSLILVERDRVYLRGVFEEREPQVHDMRFTVGILNDDPVAGETLYVYYKDGKPVPRLTVLEHANRRQFDTMPA